MIGGKDPLDTPFGYQELLKKSFSNSAVHLAVILNV